MSKNLKDQISLINKHIIATNFFMTSVDHEQFTDLLSALRINRKLIALSEVLKESSDIESALFTDLLTLRDLLIQAHELLEQKHPQVENFIKESNDTLSRITVRTHTLHEAIERRFNLVEESEESEAEKEESQTLAAVMI